MQLQHNQSVHYQRIREMLNGRPRKKVGNHTYLVTHAYDSDLDEDAIGYRLWNTDVVIFKPYYAELNTNGYCTMTTNNRINYALHRYLGLSQMVYSHRGSWYYGSGGWISHGRGRPSTTNDIPFTEGMKIAYNGSPYLEQAPEPHLPEGTRVTVREEAPRPAMTLREYVEQGENHNFGGGL